MKAILDTHTFLWWNMDDSQLSAAARNFITNGENELYLSAASAWEIAIKSTRGRLKLPDKPEVYVPHRMAAQRIQALPVEISHALHVYELPEIHTDPFDRLLIAQSQLEEIPILTADLAFAQYEVSVSW
jgi:PIN domain nuclease of toxin-antitoxin system